MGQAKDLMFHREEQRNVAISIALESGVLAKCPFHEEVYDPLAGDITPAYKLGNYKMSNGEFGNLFDSPREITDAIKDAVEEFGTECWRCAKDKD